MRLLPNVLAAVLALAPLCADAADLVVWWEKGVNPEEDAAVRETIAAFEQETRKQVDLEQPSQEGENNIEAKVLAAFRPGSRPISCSARGPATITVNGPRRAALSTSRR
jgi:ABC-type glycerol-3-phosphate transport system substrate-binding protein